MPTTLPEICCKCRALKTPDLGRYIVKNRVRKFICDACSDRSQERRRVCGSKERENRRESPAEKALRLFLKDEGFSVVSEYQIGSYFYDFAIPSLRMLIELDSRRYHHGSRAKRDRIKDHIAAQEEWHLVRVRAGRWMKSDALRAVKERERSLG